MVVQLPLVDSEDTARNCNKKICSGILHFHSNFYFKKHVKQKTRTYETNLLDFKMRCYSSFSNLFLIVIISGKEFKWSGCYEVVVKVLTEILSHEAK